MGKLFNVGEVFENKYGNSFVIVGYHKWKYHCKTLCGKYEVFGSARSILAKTLKHPLDKNQCGVGYIGIGDFEPYPNGIKCRSYVLWYGMLYRCYNTACKEYPYYGGKGITVAEEWHNFQNFAEWYHFNIKSNHNFEIDKDLLGGECYSKDTCVLLPEKVNQFISMYFKKDFIGVYQNSDGKKRRNPWRAVLHGKHKGSFKTKEDAERFLGKIRKDFANKFLEDNKSQLTETVYDILKERINNYEPFSQV